MSSMILRRLLVGLSAVLIFAALCQVAQAGHVYASVNYTSGGRGRTQVSSSRGRTQVSSLRGSQGHAVLVQPVVDQGYRRTLGFNHAYHRYGDRLGGLRNRLIRSRNVPQQRYSQPRVIVIIIR